MISIRRLRRLLNHGVGSGGGGYSIIGQGLHDHRVGDEMTVFLHACRFFPKAGGHMLLVEDNGQFSAYPARFTCRPTMNARATSTTSTAQPTMCQAIDCATKMPHTATSTGSR